MIQFCSLKSKTCQERIRFVDYIMLTTTVSVIGTNKINFHNHFHLAFASQDNYG